jgi:hypothetical protein
MVLLYGQSIEKYITLFVFLLMHFLYEATETLPIGFHRGLKTPGIQDRCRVVHQENFILALAQSVAIASWIGLLNGNCQ